MSSHCGLLSQQIMVFLSICLFAMLNSIVAQDNYLDPSGQESVERFLTRSAVLDKEERFFLQWGIGDQEDIVFKMEVRTLGYVALGFSDQASLVNADVVVGWVSNNKIYLQDRYAEGYRMPDLDDHQDWELISGSENSTHTTLVIRRKLNTCDLQDFALEYDNTVRLMYAYSFDDPIDEFTVPFDDSIKKGWRSFLLLQPVIPKETEVEFWDVLTADFAVSPDWHTKYWCKIFRRPNVTQKHHITTVDAVILGGNRGHYVHHILLLECVGGTPEDFEPHVGADGYSCYDPNSPIAIRQKCDGMFTAWGMGGDSLVLPDHMGIPLEPNSIKYYMLQVHYDNFERHVGRPGRAGFRFHHTPRLRQYDAGAFIIGAENAPNIIIPPRIQNFMVVGHNNPDCMGPGMSEEGVLISKIFLHTHLIGTKIKVRHFRGNKELPPLVFNKHYDPDYQQFHILPKEVFLLPQDQLTIECTYDSSKRSAITFGGLSTREEMCNAFVIYYPKLAESYGSLSQIPKHIATRAIDSQEIVSLTASKSDYEATFVRFMQSYDWKKTAIRRYEKIMRMARQTTFCAFGTGNRTIVKTLVSYPADLKEYKEAKYCKGLQDLKRKY